MSQGSLNKLIQEAKNLLVTDPYWYKAFKDPSNATLDENFSENDNPLLKNNSIYESAAILARLDLTSRWMGPSRITNLNVIPEKGVIANSRIFKESTRKALQKFLNNTDWMNSLGPDSPVQAIIKDLTLSVKKAGGQIKSNRIPIRNNKSSSTLIRRGELVNKLAPKEDGLDLSLISLLNAKLPPEVRNNMGQNGALVNRTGRFSESAKIIGVEKTNQGFPRLLYTYQRAPYDVFDPVIGKLPWATLGRDPKKLINKSIRSIAKDMSIGRFYTRRV